MSPRTLKRLALGAALAALGCQPEIGASCRLHTDCSASGDRICDPTFEGGYCTVFNCEPGGCPEEAVCVAYQTALAPRPECLDPSAAERLVRTFCMRSCSADSDCRTGEGYACIDLSGTNAWGAVVVERGTHSNRVCSIPISGDPKPPPTETEVCSPPLDASFPRSEAGPPRPEDAAADGTVDAGRDGPLDAAPDASDASLDADAPGPDSGVSDASGDARSDR